MKDRGKDFAGAAKRKKNEGKKGKEGKKKRTKIKKRNEHPPQHNTHSEMALLLTRETDVRCDRTANVKRP